MLAAIPGGFNSIPDIVQRRATVTQLLAAIEIPPNPNVTSEDRMVPGPDGAPEHPSSGAGSREDCYAGLVWMARNAGELRFDLDRLAVYGGSAGGGLTIATSMLARDRGFPALRFQMPIYPMIDDRNETPSSHEITDIGLWDRAGNIEARNWYLGDGKPDQYAAPARAEDLTGLPPTFIDVGTVDLFRDEDITFAMRLMQAGVPTELHVNPGGYHAAEVFVPECELSGVIWARRIEALRRALA